MGALDDWGLLEDDIGLLVLDGGLLAVEMGLLLNNNCLDNGLAVVSESRGRSAAPEMLFLRPRVDGLSEIGGGNRICSGWYMITRYQWRLR